MADARSTPPAASPGSVGSVHLWGVPIRLHFTFVLLLILLIVIGLGSNQSPVTYTVFSNLILAGFNLLPAFPSQQDFPVVHREKVVGLLGRNALLRGMAQAGACALVMQDEKLLGLLTSENLSQFLLLRSVGLRPEESV